jgi:hypothetical protein
VGVAGRRVTGSCVGEGQEGPTPPCSLLFPKRFLLFVESLSDESVFSWSQGYTALAEQTELELRISGSFEVRGGQRSPHNEQRHSLFASPNVIRVIKIKEYEVDGHVACMG